jgi:transposase
MPENLFGLPEEESRRAKPERVKGKARVLRPDRHQFTLRPTHLDALLAEDHRARIVWDFLMGLDLSRLYAEVRAVEGRAGRPCIDPAILLALWLYATLEGVGSARAIDRLCSEHDAYRWICGGVSVNYHTLSDFRVGQGEALDDLLTQSVALLMVEDLVDLERVAQDGVRVRASAGAASFRRKATLEECLEEAEKRVADLKAELEADPGGTTRRQAAARERAAEDRRQRVAAALKQWPDAASKKKKEEQEEKARVSTTDPEARVMKMPDGGFRPAFNGQFATDTKSQVVVGVDVSSLGSDMAQMPPMVEQIEARHGKPPDEILVDGGFASLDSVETVSTAPQATTVFAPVPKSRDPNRDQHEPRPSDSAAVGAWRERMGTDEAKAIYRERASTAECVNAIARNRGLQRFLVRGLHKVKAVLLLFALAHNLMRGVELRRAATAGA